MKRKLFLLLITLLAVLGCQREVTSVEGDVMEVNTQFVFNIAASNTQTKQTEGAANQTDGFRGMREVKLLAYTEGDSKDGQILSADKDAVRLYDLARAVTSGQVSSSSSRRIMEMSLPIQTNTLLFYGRAESGSVGNAVTVTSDDRYGKLDVYKIESTKGSANFQLGKRLQKKEEFSAMEKLIAGIVTVIMNTAIKGEDHKALAASDYPPNTKETNTYGFAVGTDDYPNVLKWEDHVNETGTSPVATTMSRYPLEEKLASLYTQMTSIRKGTTDADEELRAATGEATVRIIQDLWTVINSVRWAKPINESEAVAKYFAQVVHTRLLKYFSATVQTDGMPVTDVSFNLLSGDEGINARLLADSCWPEKIPADKKPTSDELKNIESMSPSNFPMNFNMPRGVAYMRYNENGYFYYPSTFNTSAQGGTPEQTESGGFGADSYYYPAEILYFANSPVRTSDLEHKASEYPETVENWDDDDKWAKKSGTGEDAKDDWTGTHVQSTTRSVAMKYDINYGVAMLETMVAYKWGKDDEGNDVTGIIYDNNHAVQKLITPTLADNAEPDKKIAVKDGSFTLTGIIIGGQPKNVGCDFLPINDPTENKLVSGFIYDRDVSVNVPASGSSSKAYTVVFDNYNYKDASSQDKVYVALEFQNNTGMDIFGNFNMIRDGGYFYLIGELDPAKAATLEKGGTIEWPTSGHVIPPYNSDGTSKQIPRIFIQDRKTSVVFKIGPHSLRYAYVTVPDLRASSITMGLSVDLKWEDGLQYKEVIVGGE